MAGLDLRRNKTWADPQMYNYRTILCPGLFAHNSNDPEDGITVANPLIQYGVGDCNLEVPV